MEIEFRAYGNKKQVEAFRSWIDPNVFDIVYGGSKGCLSGSTKVKTRSGYKEIKDVQVSDIVLTTNEKTKKNEWKPVLDTKKYHTKDTNEYHKIITFVMKGGHILSLTPNHEVHIAGSWLPSAEFARRVLDIANGSQWEVHGVHTRTPIELWTEQATYYESYYDNEGLLSSEFYVKREESELSGSPISCYSFRPKSRKQTDSESHRLQSTEQSLVELGVGHRQRERLALEGAVSSAVRKQERSEEQQHNLDRRSSIGNSTKIQKADRYKGYVRGGIRSQSGDYQRHNSSQELDAHLIEEIRFELLQGYVYDLHVQDNHNYCVTENNYIVHNSGKSYLGCALIVGDALLYPGTQYFIARKTLSDLRKYTTSSIAEVLGHWGVSPKNWKYNGQDNFYQFSNGSKIYFLGCEPRPSDPLYARFGSIQMTRGMLEEGSEIEEAAKNALSATIGRWKNKEHNLPGKLIITCNPAKNWLYSEYYLPNKEGQLESHRRFIQALPSDNKMLPPGYLEHLERTLNYNEKQRLLYGNWEYDDDPSVLIDYEAILDVFKNFSVDHGGRYITADIARLGGAKIVAIQWDGYRGHVTSWERMRLNFSLEKMREIERNHGVSNKEVLVDGDGIGAALDDFGAYQSFRNNFPAYPSLDRKKRRDGNGQIVKENFDNRKSQMGFYTADLINDRKMLLTCEDPDDKRLIIQELEQVKQKVIGTDLKKGLVPKEEVMKTLGRSPDFWDAILMRKAFDYMKGSIKIINRNGNDNRNALVYGEGRRYEQKRHL